MQSSAPIPSRCDVVVIGGGPAGSSVATMLAKEGVQVVLLEKARHPRPNVGESIIPHFWKFADQLGVSAKIEQEQFLAKSGGIIIWDGKIQQVQFSSFGYGGSRVGLHVERDRLDQILLEHAAESGVQVFEEVAAARAELDNPEAAAVLYNDRRGGPNVSGRIECKYVVDASGHNAILAGQFNSRRLVGSDGKYLGLWGYFRNSRYVGVDQKSHDLSEAHTVKPVTLVLSFEDGWVWHIIMRESTSVGLVINTGRLRGMGKAAQEKYFLESCASIPYLRDLLAPATFIEGSMFFRPDYSYYNDKIVGDNFFCIGDAAAFVDPIFSQGAVAAMYNGVVCAWAITSSMRSPRFKQSYAKIFQRQVLQYYGFSRLLTFGDFGAEGIDAEAVKAMMRTLPQNELELTLAAAMTTKRSENMRQMAALAGLLGNYDDQFGKATRLPELDL